MMPPSFARTPSCAALTATSWFGRARFVHPPPSRRQSSLSAGRPAGGEALALRSAYAMLKARYGA